MTLSVTRKWAETVKQGILESSSQACTSLFTKVISGTPVDSGHAAGNWRTSPSPPTAEIQRNGKDAAIQEVMSVLTKDYFAKIMIVFFYYFVD